MAVDINDTHVRYDRTVLDKHVMEENNYSIYTVLSSPLRMKR